jgi:ferredoxin--NADP+ reductase
MTPDEIAGLRARRYNATVISLRKIHSDLMILRVRPDGPRPPHVPGQYTTLGLGMWEPRAEGCQAEALKPGGEARVVRRAYSISCPVLGEDGRLWDGDAADWLEFYVVLVRETDDPTRAPALTPRLFVLREGDRLQLGERATGHYTLDGIAPTDAVVFLSTGTGEAPHNYMTWALLRAGHAGPILAACCVRYRRDLGYAPVHKTLSERYTNYTYLPVATRELAAGEPKVYLQDLVTCGRIAECLGRPLDPATTHVYLCGNPAMIGPPTADHETGARRYPRPTGVVELLETRFGFTADDPAAKVRGNVHFEKYW